MDRKKVALIASFTIDIIKIDNNIYEKIGGPAYYSGLTLKILGFDPIVITALGSDNKRKIRELLSTSNETQDLEILDTDPNCVSIYTFHHTYTDAGRSSMILKTGCRINIDSIPNDISKDVQWILISPVFKEVRPEDVRKIPRTKNIALDLQGYGREINNQRVISSLDNIKKNIEELPRIGIMHLSSDDIRSDTSDHKKDLERISFLASKTDIIAYTIGSGGGYLGLVLREREREHDKQGESKIEWYYIPPYAETDGGDPTGCGDIFLASIVSGMIMNHGIIEAAVKASVISGMRVSRGFPIKTSTTEIDNIAEMLRRKIYRVATI
ncbi:MAG: hypothetical protein DJ555_05310 [Desulfurococcaceae archaeon]|nr:MAG: hypothetical protein DJ555_05310 [Desulfurococcaceae archaeon]